MQGVIRFAAFEVDSRTGELRKHGIRLKLAEQPFRVLMALLENAGELVTREELKRRVWTEAEFGDFEQGLNRTVSKLREALGDSAAHPRYIETLPGRGYRFIYPVERTGEPPPPVPLWRRRRTHLAGVAVAAAALLLMLAVWLFRPPSVAPLRWRKLTTDNFQKRPPALCDGTRIYFVATYGEEEFLVQVPLEGGQPARLPVTLPGPFAILQDISEDGQQLLMTVSASSDARQRARPVWSLRVADGTARRLGDLQGFTAAWEPGTGRIAYTTLAELWIAAPDGTRSRRLVEAKGKFLEAVCWGQRGGRIRFSQRDSISGRISTWEVKSDGSGLREVFPGWSQSHSTMGWTTDGRIGLFGGGGMIWADPEPRIALFARRQPVPLLTDAPEFLGPVRPRQAKFFHAVGTDRLAELQRYDKREQSWKPLLDGLSVQAAEYSPDARRIAYVTYPQHTLWVRDADGSKPIQLTSEPAVVMFPRWSPDGRRIACNAQEAPNQPLRLYTIDSGGGSMRPVTGGERGAQGYATWSPDGKELLYGLFRTNVTDPVYIRVFDLATGKVTKLEGSDGLFAPRYAPDATAIAATRRGSGEVLLYRRAERRWEEIPGGAADWPSWARDSRSLFLERDGGIMRYDVARRKLEPVVETGRRVVLGGSSLFLGNTPEGDPMRTWYRDNRQVYELRFDSR